MDAVAQSDNEGNTPQDGFARTLVELLPSNGELATLSSIIETIIAHFKRETATGDGENDLDRETAFLLAFQDTVSQFCSQRNGGSVREFLRYWDEKKDSLAMSSDENGDSVNVMTIHKAKGLEFDCVVLPFANWQLDGNYREDKYWVTREVFIDALSGLPLEGGLPDAGIVPPLVRIDATVTSQLIEQGVIGGMMRDFVNKCVSDATIDNLNKTYVAMTRPCIEMHIFCGTDADRKHHNHLKPLLSGFAQSAGTMRAITLPDGTADSWFEYGQPSSAAEIAAFKRAQEERDQEEAPLSIPITGYTVSDIPAELRVRSENVSSSHIDAGIRLHSLLSRIGDRDDVERVIAQGLKQGTINNDENDLCGLASVNAHMRDPIMDERCRVAAWFDPANKVYSERTITTANPKAKDGIENLRPDRIVRRPDGRLLVIDYKTGQRDDKKYCSKMKRYMDKLHEMGMAPKGIEGRIWYTTLDTIIDENGMELGFCLD
jgi:ATP-dependent exoDNAse (exonuclease V) beta subunit